MKQSSADIRSAYDAVAREYADRFSEELTHKPLDRELLQRFATEVRGPVRGLDLSAELVSEAARRHPGLAFETGDLLALAVGEASLAGVVAFDAIVHFAPNELRRALAEMDRVLRPGGRLLLAFHIGDNPKRRREVRR